MSERRERADETLARMLEFALTCGCSPYDVWHLSGMSSRNWMGWIRGESLPTMTTLGRLNSWMDAHPDYQPERRQTKWLRSPAWQALMVRFYGEVRSRWPVAT